jgi:GH24 family phage-related lysozyme (muramidase)
MIDQAPSDGWLTPAMKLVCEAESCARKVGSVFHAYPDVREGWALPTIGWGSTGPDVRQGTVWSQSQCDTRLLTDLVHVFGPGVDRVTTGVALTANQKAALVSFAYNEGLKKLASSTLLRELRAGHIAVAADEFDRWIYADGVELPGLVKRRAAERKVFLA